MDIREVLNEKEWNDFVKSFNQSQFLHSWQWGVFQQNLGRKFWRLGIFENNEMVGCALLIKLLLPLNKNYLYCPRGPIFKKNNQEIINKFFEKIKELSQREKSIFLRFEPSDIKNLNPGVKNYQQVPDVQPRQTLLVDLQKTEEEILAAMHQKTRYNIRLAEKRGVTIRQGRENDYKFFLKLILETAKRDNFRPHSLIYYQKLLELNQDFIKLYLAEHQGKVLAVNLMVYFGDTCTYAHGASGNECKNLMAPHLLQWHCLKDAKERGYRYYDFWGINEKKWPGVTRFKKGFVNEKTGLFVSYPGTFDLPLNKKWYQLYCLAKKFI